MLKLLAEEPRRKTLLTSIVNQSGQQFRNYFDLLEGYGLMTTNQKLYYITEKGRTFLSLLTVENKIDA